MRLRQDVKSYSWHIPTSFFSVEMSLYQHVCVWEWGALQDLGRFLVASTFHHITDPPYLKFCIRGFNQSQTKNLGGNHICTEYVQTFSL